MVPVYPLRPRRSYTVIPSKQVKISPTSETCDMSVISRGPNAGMVAFH